MENIYKTKDILERLSNIPEPDYEQAKFIFHRVIDASVDKDKSESLNRVYRRCLSDKYTIALVRNGFIYPSELDYDIHFLIYSCIRGETEYRLYYNLALESMRDSIDPESEYVSLTSGEKELLDSIPVQE